MWLLVQAMEQFLAWMEAENVVGKAESVETLPAGSNDSGCNCF